MTMNLGVKGLTNHMYIIQEVEFYTAILYKYWLRERVTWEIVTPTKPMSTEAKPSLTFDFDIQPNINNLILVFRM